MRTYNVQYTVEYSCVVMVPEETDEDENLYSEDVDIFLLNEYHCDSARQSLHKELE